MFTSEQEMSEWFEQFLLTKFGSSYIKECKNLWGRPDYVVYNKEEAQINIVSFELKLCNWKRASMQAFKYKSFSHTVFVVLPENKIKVAKNNIGYFKQYNIGLAVFGKSDLFHVINEPNHSNPFSESLSEKLINRINAIEAELYTA